MHVFHKWESPLRTCTESGGRGGGWFWEYVILSLYKIILLHPSQSFGKKVAGSGSGQFVWQSQTYQLLLYKFIKQRSVLLYSTDLDYELSFRSFVNTSTIGSAYNIISWLHCHVSSLILIYWVSEDVFFYDSALHSYI